MDKYMINGVEIEFDIFDMDSMERYYDELDRYKEEVERTVEGETLPQNLRRVCEAMMDFFDAVVGDGTARKIFGDQTNVKACIKGIREFINAANANIRNLKEEINSETEMQLNRAQRRTAERQKQK